MTLNIWVSIFEEREQMMMIIDHLFRWSTIIDYVNVSASSVWEVKLFDQFIQSDDNVKEFIRRHARLMLLVTLWLCHVADKHVSWHHFTWISRNIHSSSTCDNMCFLHALLRESIERKTDNSRSRVHLFIHLLMYKTTAHSTQQWWTWSLTINSFENLALQNSVLSRQFCKTDWR